MSDLLEVGAPMFPITAYELGAIPEQGAIVIRFPFVSHPLQKPTEADPGRRYVLNVAQAIELRDALDRLLQRVKAAGYVPSSADRH